MSIDLDKMLYVAIQAALKAGEAIMEVYDSADFGIEIKEDASPLTKADKNANMVINGFLEPTNIPIISEGEFLNLVNQNDSKLAKNIDKMLFFID